MQEPIGPENVYIQLRKPDEDHRRAGLLPAATAEKISRFETRLSQWLSALPKPVGVMACNDVVGGAITAAAQRAGIPVPYEAGVIGVDNDPLYCLFSNPPLSSIELPVTTIGFKAAALLDRLMRGEKPPQMRALLAPANLITRRSSDVLAFHDPNIARALQFIWENAGTHMDVDDVAKSAFLSRRTLDRKFSAALGHSVKEEVQRARLDKVKKLLGESEHSVEEIAGMSGFSSTGHLIRAFSASEGMSPRQYRAKHQCR